MMTVLTCLNEETRNQFCPGFNDGIVKEDTLQQVVELYTRDGREKYHMTVMKVDGMRHGTAELKDSQGNLRFRFTYNRGQLTGLCRRYRADGTLEMEMELQNNILKGAITKYDKNGIQLPENVQSSVDHQSENLPEKVEEVQYLYDEEGRMVGELKGNHIVWRASFYDNQTKTKIEDGNNSILYKGQFALDEQQKVIKHGKGVEYKNGRPYYVGEFVNDQPLYKYTPYEDQALPGYYEEKTTYGARTSICQLEKNTLIKHGWSIEFSEETEEPKSKKEYKDGKEVYTQVEVAGNEMTEYDKSAKKIYKGEFRYLNGEFIRWGQGIEYENEEREKYDGEFVNGYYHGEGKHYVNGQLHFKGKWEYGYPQGHGKLYGGKEMEGNWKMGYCGGVDYEKGRKRGLFEFTIPFNSREKEIERRRKKLEGIQKKWEFYVNQQLCHFLRLANEPVDQIQRMELSDNSMNMYPRITDDIPFNIGQFRNIKTLIIGSNCCKYVSQFIVKELNFLESICIDENSFSRNTDGKKIKGSFCVSNCPTLKVLSIRNGCFSEFECFELSKLNSLETLVLNNIGFEGRELHLKGMLHWNDYEKVILRYGFIENHFIWWRLLRKMSDY